MYKFWSKLINFLFDSTTRTEFNWLHILSTFGVITNNKIIIKKLVGVTCINPWNPVEK